MMVSYTEGIDYKQLNRYKTTVIRELNLAKGCRFNLRARSLHFRTFKAKINKQNKKKKSKKIKRPHKNKKYTVLQIIFYTSSLHIQFLIGE